jgi:hypothetical protein
MNGQSPMPHSRKPPDAEPGHWSEQPRAFFVELDASCRLSLTGDVRLLRQLLTHDFLDSELIHRVRAALCCVNQDAMTDPSFNRPASRSRTSRWSRTRLRGCVLIVVGIHRVFSVDDAPLPGESLSFSLGDIDGLSVHHKEMMQTRLRQHLPACGINSLFRSHY